MARLASLDPRLDPYFGTTNFARAEVLDVTPKRLSKDPRASGLSIIVLNLDAPALLTSILTGFRLARNQFAVRGISCEVLIGDTGSTDPGVLQMMSDPPDGVTYVRGLPYHFSTNNNTLVEQSRYESLLFLNNDVLIDQNPSALVDAYELHVSTGEVVSVALDFEDGRVQHVGVDFLKDDRFFGLPFHPRAGETSMHQAGKDFRAASATGAFLMMYAHLFAELGGFDENYRSECQDIDLCLKAHRVGVGCRILDVGKIVHLENATRPTGEENWSDRRRFIRRWSSYIELL
jgi:GT2 family glycosyltransferase